MPALFATYESVAYKKLTAVDLPNAGSNQHELNGVASLRAFFGSSEAVKGPIIWKFYLDGQDPLVWAGDFTFYDARAGNPHREEWRLYYTGEFLASGIPGDTLILTRDKDNRISGLVFQQGSGWLRAAVKFFGISAGDTRFRGLSAEQLKGDDVGPSRRWIAEQLQLEFESESTELDESLFLGDLGGVFPPAAQLSRLAREKAPADSANPDRTLLSWIEWEETLFLALERSIVEPRVGMGFDGMGEFVKYSLSVLNRRKSRMGLSLQNQLAALFESMGVSYTAQPTTEGKKKPDFIFPGIGEYRDESFSPDLLTMLAAKSTCKERWRQILTEADRIPQKHLCTLDQAISEAQAAEMAEYEVTLVVPAPLLDVYQDLGARKLCVAEFVALVMERRLRAEKRGV